jgi:hypothetical protein
MGTLSTLIYLVQWHYVRAVALAVRTYKNVTGQWPACVECGKPCNGDPRYHDGPCTRDELVFCSTWCSMNHGRKNRPWKTTRTELRTHNSLLVAAVELRTVAEGHDPNPWRWYLYHPQETGTAAGEIEDAETVAEKRLRQRPEFRDAGLRFWKTTESSLFAPNGRRLAHVKREGVRWRWTVLQPYETGVSGEMSCAQDAASDRIAERSKAPEVQPS